MSIAAGTHALDLAVSNPVVVTVVRYVELAGIPISRATIYAAFAAHAAFPALRLAEVQEQFDRWGIPSAAFRTEAAELPAMPVPVIASMGGEGGDGATLVVVRFWGRDRIDIVHPGWGNMRLSWPAFLDRWTGILFAAIAREAPPEPDLARKAAAERRAARTYRASIRFIEAFVPPDRCAAIIAHCERLQLFARSPVERHGDPRRRQTVSSLRTSSSALIADRAGPLFADLYQRITGTLGVDPTRIEDIQCVRYDPGERFGIHVDGRDRKQTLLLYLNADFEGGGTIFPDLDLVVAPKTGAALLFDNLDAAGRVIPWSRHAGLAPRGGRKYACNIWIM